MTTVAVTSGAFAAGFILVVMLLYTVACTRGCLRWRIGVHVLALGLVVQTHVTLSVVTLVTVDRIAQAQPWRAPLLAALHTLLAASAPLLFRTVRERVSDTCTLGHSDWWHRARPREA